MNQNFTAPYHAIRSDACPIARCQFWAPDSDAAFVLVELLVLDQFFLAGGAERREELRRVAAERAHRYAALQELVSAFSTSQASSTEHGHRHARRRAQRIRSGGEEE